MSSNFEKKKLLKENDYQVGSGTNLTCAKISPKKCNVLAAGDDQNNIILWKLTTTKPKKYLTGAKSETYSMIFNEDATTLFTGTVGGTAHVWDMEASVQKSLFKGHNATCTALCTSLNDQYLVTGSQDAKVKLWDQR